MMRVLWNIEERMELVLGSPPRLQPLADHEIEEPAVGAINRIREMNDLAADLPVPEMFATVGKHPELLAAFLDFGVRFLGRTALADRDRELAILRTGWLCGAPYEWGEHVIIGKEAGLTAEEIERVTIGSSAPGWDEREAAILRACEELHHDSMISDETWGVLCGYLDDRQLIELPILAGQYHKVAYIQNTLRLRTRECNPGLSAR